MSKLQYTFKTDTLFRMLFVQNQDLLRKLVAVLLRIPLFKANTEEDLEKIRAMEVPEMEQAINAYYTITASPEFREIERLRAKARHDEAQALHHAEQKAISKRNIEFAKARIADGEPIDKIVRYTGLTEKEIEALA